MPPWRRRTSNRLARFASARPRWEGPCTRRLARSDRLDALLVGGEDCAAGSAIEVPAAPIIETTASAARPQLSTTASHAAAARTVAVSSMRIERPIARSASRVECHAAGCRPSRRRSSR